MDSRSAWQRPSVFAWWLCLCLMFLAVGVAQASRMTATATVTEFHNLRSGDLFHCIDPVPFGCDRGDFYASVLALRGADGATVNCGPTAVTVNVDNLVPPDPAWTCSTGTSGLVAPVTLVLRIMDFDGRTANSLDGDDPVDIGAGYYSESLIDIPQGNTTETFKGDNGQVTVSLSAATVPLTITGGLDAGSSTGFDPRLGEIATATFRLNADDPGVTATSTVMDRFGNQVAIPSVTQVDSITFRVSWDGLDATNSLSPVGTYSIGIIATDGTLTASTTAFPLNIVTRTDALRLAKLDAPRWWVTSGPLHAKVFASTATDAELALYQGQNCDSANKISILSSQTWTGQTDFTWGGFLPTGTRAGQLVSNGSYSVGLHSNTGLLSYGCLALDVVPPPSIRTYIEADPAVPLDGGPSTIRVVVMGDDNSLRRTASIAVFVATSAELTAKTEPTTATMVCTAATTCTVMAPPPASTTATESFGYRAVASDSDIGGITAPTAADTGWHISHRTTLAIVNSSVATRPDFAAGVVQQNFGTFSLANAMDVGYRPGSGFDISTAAGWMDFMRAVRDVQRRLFGLSTSSFLWASSPLPPSALASTPPAYSQWIVPLPVSVAPRTLASSWADLSCSVDNWNDGTFDAVGVLHNVNCRDSTTSLESPTYFTAAGTDVAWHELHHALYGLGDEYDGRTVAPFSADLPPAPRNIFDSPSDCAADPLGPVAGSCSEVSADFDDKPFRPSGRFRLDPHASDDVMNFNGPLEQGADTRRVILRTTICRAGGC